MEKPYLVDLQATINLHAQAHEMCDCAYCANIRLAFNDHPINKSGILNEFGFDLQGEMEIMDLFWNGTRDKRVYEVFYAVQGTLIEDGYSFEDGEALVHLYQSNSPKLCYDLTDMKPPCFFLVLRIELPWLLEEIPED